jgi:hypothetical protein
MRAYLLCFAALVGCVSDDSSTKDAGSDVTNPNDGSPNDVITPADANDAGAWSPTAFGTDLTLWLVGDNVSDTAGSVDTWYDQSTYKTNPTQGDPSIRPLHEKGVLNGHDVVDFNGAGVTVRIDPGDAGTTPPSMSFGQTDDFVIGAVVSESTNMPTGYVFDKTLFNCIGSCAPKDGLVFAINQPATLDQVSARESSADPYLFTTGKPLADHAYHVVVLRRIGETTLQLRTDTVPKNATITGFDISQPQASVTIGASDGTFQGTFAFRMAELIAVHRTTGAINDAEVTSIETYLKAKYKTP